MLQLKNYNEAVSKVCLQTTQIHWCAKKNSRCAISSGALCSSHYPGTGAMPKKQMSEKEMRAKAAREIFTYTGEKTTTTTKITTNKQNKQKGLGGKKQTTTPDANFIPAEKLTTGKKSPSILKFSNIP